MFYEERRYRTSIQAALGVENLGWQSAGGGNAKAVASGVNGAQVGELDASGSRSSIFEGVVGDSVCSFCRAIGS